MSESREGARRRAKGRTSALPFLLLLVLLALPRFACAQPDVYFGGPVEDKALRAFFGNSRGSFILAHQPMTHQMVAALCNDFTATGRPISRMPKLGPNLFLDDGGGGGVCEATSNEGGAVILTPDGKILAAEITWQNCWSMASCDVDAKYHVMFVRDEKNLPFAERVFGQMIFQEVLACRRNDGAGLDYSGSLAWGDHPLPEGLVMQIAVLDKSGIWYLPGLQ